MPRWSRDELESAFQTLTETLDHSLLEGSFEHWVARFTEDVTYRDLGHGFENGFEVECRGRENVRRSVEAYFSIDPHRALCLAPVSWSMIDEERGWVVCGRSLRMRDPGTGEVFEEKSYSRLGYAGDGLWSFAEDVYNPVRLHTMQSIWLYVRRRCQEEGIDLPEVGPEHARQAHAEVWEEAGDSRWSRDEIAGAVEHFEAVGNRAFAGSDHEEWLQCYTDDVTHRELGFGYGWEQELHGRDAVRRWIDAHCDIYPINHMTYFPIPWFVIDERRGQVLLEYRNCMSDPGDGRSYEESSYARLLYAGNGQWRLEEDLYSPLRMRAMLDRWRDARERLEGGSHAPSGGDAVD